MTNGELKKDFGAEGGGGGAVLYNQGNMLVFSWMRANTRHEIRKGS